MGLLACPRKRLIPVAAITAAVTGLPSAAHAAWPDHPVTIVVPFSPGGAGDSGARLIAPKTAEQLGQPVVIDNKAGAGGVVGTAFVAKSKPDGYTLLMGTAANPIGSAYIKNLPYDFDKDLIPVVQVANVPGVLLVAPSLPVKNVKELVAYLRANPGKVNYGSPGMGTSVHLAGELFCYMPGWCMCHTAERAMRSSICSEVKRA